MNCQVNSNFILNDESFDIVKQLQVKILSKSISMDIIYIVLL